MDGRWVDHDLRCDQQCAQGAGGRFVQRIVALIPERTGLCRRRLFSIAKPGRAREFATADLQTSWSPTTDQADWWSADLGVPSSLGAQNEVRYAYFPATQRLAVDINGEVTVYDTQGHQISGFSQQQPGSASLSFSSQLGDVDMSHLPVVSGADGAKKSPKPMHEAAAEQQAATSTASAPHEKILAAIERMAELHARGVLTDAEFSAKKAELLGRLGAETGRAD